MRRKLVVYAAKIRLVPLCVKKMYYDALTSKGLHFAFKI